MKNKIRRTLDTLVVGGSIAIASLIPQNAKGQNWYVQHMPKEKINMFISQDNTPQAAEYNNLTDLAKQNDTIQSRLNKDWVSTVAKWEYDNYPSHSPPAEYPVWDCGNSMLQLMINSIKKFGIGIYGGGGFQDDRFLYHKYTEFNLDSILKDEGTFVSNGDAGLPIYTVGLTDPVTVPGGHGMNALLKNIKGSSMTKWSSWNFIEPQLKQINVQPGQAYMPSTCSFFMVEYWFVNDRSDGKKELAVVPVAFFTIKDGVATFGGLNPNLKDLLITDWENDKPALEVYPTTNSNKLKAKATDANLKDFVYSADGGSEKPLTSDVETDLGLLPGTHTIKVTARDYFRLITDTIFTRVIPTTVNYAPKVKFITPQPGVKYPSDVRLKGNITDAEGDPITASYSLDGGQAITLSPEFDNPLSLVDGIHKIVITASDPTHTGKYAPRDSTTFEFKKAVGIEPGPTLDDKTSYYPNPVQDILHIKYKSGMSGNAFMSITTLDGKQIMSKKINGASEDDFDMTTYKPGIYIFKVVDGIVMQRIMLIKQ